METSYGLNQLTINSNNCKDKARGRGDRRSINTALTKQQLSRQMREMQRHMNKIQILKALLAKPRADRHGTS